MGKAGKIVRLVRVMRIMRIFKLVRHFAGLQSLIYTLNQVSCSGQDKSWPSQERLQRISPRLATLLPFLSLCRAAILSEILCRWLTVLWVANLRPVHCSFHKIQKG